MRKNVITFAIITLVAICSIAALVISIVSLNNKPVYLNSFLHSQQIEKIELYYDNYPGGELKVSYERDEINNDNPILAAMSLTLMSKTSKQLYAGNDIKITITYSETEIVEISLVGSGKIAVDGKFYSANSYLYNTAQSLLFI